jgi:hypothetical protein
LGELNACEENKMFEESVRTNLDNLVRGIGNERKSYSATSANLSGGVSAAVDRCIATTKFTHSAVGGAINLFQTSSIGDPNLKLNFKHPTYQPFAPRGWGAVIHAKLALNEYIIWNNGSAQDWTSVTVAKDTLLVWVWSDIAQTAGQVKLSIRNASNAQVTGGSVDFPAIPGKKWTLCVLDISGANCSAVQYLRVVNTNTATVNIMICDIVRAATAVLTNGVYKDMLSELGFAAYKMRVDIKNGTTKECIKLYINSLANDPVYIDEEFSGWQLIDHELINAFFLTGCTDTSQDYYIDVVGRSELS